MKDEFNEAQAHGMFPGWNEKPPDTDPNWAWAPLGKMAAERRKKALEEEDPVRAWERAELRSLMDRGLGAPAALRIRAESIRKARWKGTRNAAVDVLRLGRAREMKKFEAHKKRLKELRMRLECDIGVVHAGPKWADDLGCHEHAR